MLTVVHSNRQIYYFNDFSSSYSQVYGCFTELQVHDLVTLTYWPSDLISLTKPSPYAKGTESILCSLFSCMQYIQTVNLCHIMCFCDHIQPQWSLGLWSTSVVWSLGLWSTSVVCHAYCMMTCSSEAAVSIINVAATCSAVTTSFPQKTEDWTFCPVLHLFCLMSVSKHWLLRDPTIIATCPCPCPRTYATLK